MKIQKKNTFFFFGGGGGGGEGEGLGGQGGCDRRIEVFWENSHTKNRGGGGGGGGGGGFRESGWM